MSTITGPGWRGGNLSDYYQKAEAIQKANPNAFVVFFFDEIDKHSSIRENEITFNPIVDLLPLLDCPNGKFVYPYSNSGQNEGTLEINTNKCAFIFSGSFTGIEEKIRNRLSNETPIAGFLGKQFPSGINGVHTLRASVTLADLVEYGLSEEFVSRCNMTINIPPMTIDELKCYIAGSPNSLLRQYQILLDSSIHIHPEAINYLAEKAHSTHGGARVIDGMLAPLLYDAILFRKFGSSDTSVVIQYNNESNNLECVYR